MKRVEAGHAAGGHTAGTARRDPEVRSLCLTLAVYLLVFGMKLAVYLLTGVMALFAEALHTLSDIFVSSFLLIATIWSRKKEDEVYLFGHGRAQNVAALVAAVLFISFTSYKLYEESIPRLFTTAEASYQNLPLALGVIVVSMVVAATPIISLLRQKTRGAAAKAQLMELFNDELGLLAALAGTLALGWGFPIADPLAAMAVATIIAVNAIGLLRENLGILMGRSPGREYLARIEEIARSVSGVRGVHEIRAQYVGPQIIHTGFHIEVDRGTPVEEADRISEEVQQKLHSALGCQYCFIHMDPAEPATREADEGS